MAETPNEKRNVQDDLERQRQYVDRLKKRGGQGIGIVFTDAFLRGIRDLGYKSHAWALSEQVDNSVQAGATAVVTAFGYRPGNQSCAKPDHVAVIDDGVGMIPEMIRAAVKWGGTHRWDDRDLFGRYAYGLPSSAVSIAARYTVYSKVADGDWHAVTVDIEHLAKVSSDSSKIEESLAPRKKAPPAWIDEEWTRCGLQPMTHGTAVVLEDLDRLQNGWKTTRVFSSKLKEHFGVIYRHFSPQPKLFVDGDHVQPVDPLFLMENGRFFDETPVRAERVEAAVFQTDTPSGKAGTVRVRASYLPPNFQWMNEFKRPPQRGARVGKHLAHRYEVMKSYNGLLICRAGRQIDCIKPPWTAFQNLDRNIKIEIDFDPSLDEYFGITTSKQQITIDEVLWEKLKSKGKLAALIGDLRKKFRQAQDALEAKLKSSEEPDEPRASEVAMQESAKFKPKQAPPSPEKTKKAREALEKKVEDVARATGEQPSQVRAKLEAQVTAHPYRVTWAAIPDGPFYRAERVSKQRSLVLNTQHPFYRTVYEPASPDVRAAFELLLFVLSDAELDAEGDFESFYASARNNWSERLRYALMHFAPEESMRDKAAAVAEAADMEVAIEEEG